MRTIFVIPCLLLGVSGMAVAVDYQQLGESVDTQKAMDSLDHDKATVAVKEQDVK